jgi:hypothetical protein
MKHLTHNRVLGCIYLPETNTPAYYESPLIADIKSFLTFARAIGVGAPRDRGIGQGAPGGGQGAPGGGPGSNVIQKFLVGHIRIF